MFSSDVQRTSASSRSAAIAALSTTEYRPLALTRRVQGLRAGFPKGDRLGRSPILCASVKPISPPPDRSLRG